MNAKYIGGNLLIVAIILLSTECSAQWISQNSGVMVTLSDVAMVDASTAIVVGYGGNILKTTDGGKHWVSKKSGTTNDLNAISFSSFLEAYAAGNGVVCHTTDGGESWNATPVNGNYTCVSTGGYPLYPAIYFASSDNGQIRFSYDNGKIWRDTVLINGVPIVSVSNVTALNSTFTKIVTPSSVWETFNGIQYTKSYPPLGFWDNIISAEFKSQTQYLLCNGGNGGYWSFILKKTSTDSLWKRISIDFPYLSFLNHFQSFSDTSIIYACGLSGKIFKSVDNGDNWSSQNVPTKKYLRSLSFYQSNVGFVVGDSGLILHTENGGVTSVKKEQSGLIPVQATLYPNYPNPFNPTTEIRFSLNRSSYVTVSVHNVLGKEISIILSEQKEAGTYTYSWDATGLPSGVYYCRFCAENKYEVQKMLLLK
jgi:photosystem II stability/assembly factor-like uncharacterized protein